MADEKNASKKPKLKNHQVDRKIYKHALGEAKRDPGVKDLSKKQRKRAAGAKARKLFRARLGEREAANAAKAAKAAPPAAPAAG